MAEAIAIEQLSGLAMATIMAARGHGATSVGAALGTDLPDGPRALSAGGTTFIGTGPGSWLAISQSGGPDFAAQLAAKLAGIAAVSDQSSGYVVTRISGEGARTLLQRGASIDFHPDAFGPGCVATSVIAHIGVIIWQTDDRPCYELAVFRSFAADFQHWLDVTRATL